jgi:organic radical activating enzyme
MFVTLSVVCVILLFLLLGWQENKKHGYFKYMLDENVVKDNLVNEDYLLPLLEKNIRKGTLKHISISGGEPLISDAHYTLLNFLIRE